jgi:hypothetical protein
MKIFLFKVAKVFADNSDFLIDGKQIIAMTIFATAWLKPILDLFAEYGLNADYGLFAVFGQTFIYIARYLYPKFFPTQDNVGVITWVLRFLGNNILAFTFGIFFTPLLSNYMGEQNISIIAVSTFIGAFYELGLKRLIKYAYTLSQKDTKETIESKEDTTEAIENKEV